MVRPPRRTGRRGDDHAAITGVLIDGFGVDGWWAHTVALGYERITGRRVPGQQHDGTFAANKSRTVTADAQALREMLLDDDERRALFPGHDLELRSRPTSKNLRFGLDDGVAEIALDPRADGRVRVVVQHHRLPSPEAVEEWKAFWDAWLHALDDT